MGTVYRVWDLKRNVPLAMKVLHADLADDQVMFDRFKREARALRKLEHPNIVPFYGLYQEPSLIFLLERYIDGPTLKEVLAEKKGLILPAQDILCIIKAISSAVGYAHSNNVIHCDIKAANVMIDKGGHIYLGDFGIARHAESDVTAMPGAGTPAYMAPEQILGKAVTRETDIYALGVLLFELLTGQRPFRGNETSSERSGNTVNERIRYAHLNLPAPDPRVLDPRISGAVSAIVLQALEKDPSARFTSCQELFMGLCSAFGIPPDQVPDRLTSVEVSKNPIPPEPDLVRSGTTKPVVTKSPLMFIGGAAVLIVVMVFALLSRGNRGPTGIPSLAIRIVSTETHSPLFSTNPPVPVEPTNTSMSLQPTITKQPTITATRPASTSTNTPLANADPCREGMTRHFNVGDKVRVCTGQDRLILRNDPSPEGSEIFRMYPGVKLVIIDGPNCGSQDTWWFVSVKAGSWVWDGHEFATTSEETGWIREGGRDGDNYYICPEN